MTERGSIKKFVIESQKGRADLFARGHGHGHGHGATLNGGGGLLPTHQVFGHNLLDQHLWRHTVLRLDFLLNSDWRDISVPPHPADDSKETMRELDHLKRLQENDEREARYDEILSETTEFIGLFENVCFFDAHTHPVTSGLVQTMLGIGWDVVQYYKERFGRVRPSVLDPELEPLIRVPNFSAYPSGHATQSQLVAEALKAVVPDASGKLHDWLNDIAGRVGENREWAGVHYSSDTLVGCALAMNVWELISTGKSGNLRFNNVNFEAVICAARDEWQCPSNSGGKCSFSPG